MTAFDFSTYHHCPRGWRIMRADSELWLDQVSTDRTYKIRAPMRGEFELYYDAPSLNLHDQFVARADSILTMFRMCGLLMPQPVEREQPEFTVPRKHTTKRRDVLTERRK